MHFGNKKKEKPMRQQTCAKREISHPRPPRVFKAAGLQTLPRTGTSESHSEFLALPLSTTFPSPGLRAPGPGGSHACGEQKPLAGALVSRGRCPVA